MYSEKVRRHFTDPHNVGPLEGATHVGAEGKRGVGNYVVMHLRVEDGTIREAAFQTYGCVGAISCACELTDMVAGKSIQDALQITPEEVMDSLGGLPLGKHHCAGLAVGALHNALADTPG